MWNKPARTVNGEKGIAISATDLYKAYSANEKAADSIYLNKAIEVSGLVAGAEKNQDGGTMLILETGDPVANIQCTMQEKNANADKGKNVTVKGFCSGSGITGISLTGCILK